MNTDIFTRIKKVIFFLCLVYTINTNAQCWSQTSAGDSHTLAIKTDGTLWAWGNNYCGSLGDGTNEDKNVPTKIGIDNNWSKVYAGNNHSLAIKTDGTLWAWGCNYSGQLGDGTNEDRNVPTKIGTENIWSQISAGYGHCLAIKTDGTLWAWGFNDYGQLGDENTTVYKNAPTKIGIDNNWSQIGAGGRHSLAIKTDGTLWAWGFNYYGQLGDGTEFFPWYLPYKNVPTKIGADKNWSKICPGTYHSLAIKTDGTLWAWGNNEYGELGDGTMVIKNVPAKIGTDNNWSQISAGWGYSLAIKTDGTVWTWGVNYQGQLGDGTSKNKNIPTKIGTDNNWSQISALSHHSLAIKTDGTLWAWGDNYWGQLANGTCEDCYVPNALAYPNIAIPNLTTTPTSSITNSKASSGGNILSDGGASVTLRGVCWNTTGNPTIADSKTSDGTGNGIFTSLITGLSPSTTYMVRAYATNSVGTAYGNEIIINTLVGVKEMETGKNISIYPNPTNGTVYISNFKSKIQEVGVYNMLGVRVHSSFTNQSSSVEIDLSSYLNGIYYLEIQSENEKVFKKIIKE